MWQWGSLIPYPPLKHNNICKVPAHSRRCECTSFSLLWHYLVNGLTHFSSSFPSRAVVLIQGQFCVPENIANVWRNIFGWHNWRGKCYWNLVARRQRCCSTPYKTQDSSHNKQLTSSNIKRAEIEKNLLQVILHTAARVILSNTNFKLLSCFKKSRVV